MLFGFAAGAHRAPLRAYLDDVTIPVSPSLRAPQCWQDRRLEPGLGDSAAPRFPRPTRESAAILSGLARSQGGAHAGAWLSAAPSEPALTLAPQALQLALRRRLRLPLPLSPNRCAPSPGCGQQVDEYGDHALACPRTGLLARRAKIVERAWVRVAREAVGSDGQVIPQQWLVRTTAPGVPADDRRRLDFFFAPFYNSTYLVRSQCLLQTTG